MNEDITQDVHLIMQQVYTQNSQESQEPDEEEVIQVHHYPNALVIIHEKNKSTSTNIPLVDSTPEERKVNQTPQLIPYLTVGMFLLLILSSLMFQFYVLFHPPTVTVTIIPRSQQIHSTGTLQLGRVLSPITISQSATTQATGRGHQNAAQATGSITFYNGQPAQQFVPAGTTLTGTDGVQVIIDADATIPAGNPPAYGQVTVPAHASNSGSAGNIQALDINTTVHAVFVKNLRAFSGGQDERNFQTVTKTDIDNTAQSLKATLAQSVQGALQAQSKTNESLVTQPCTPTVAADHQIGQEATTVKVTVSETCSGIAYNDQELTSKVTQLLTSQATKKLGSGYSMLENPQITVASAITSKPVTLSFRSVSTWVYALTTQEQQHSKKIIAGKYKQNALQLLYSLPGIESVSLQFSGFGDATKLPKDISHIHLLILYTAA